MPARQRKPRHVRTKVAYEFKLRRPNSHFNIPLGDTLPAAVFHRLSPLALAAEFARVATERFGPEEGRDFRIVENHFEVGGIWAVSTHNLGAIFLD
jgi:hypothetical protein